MRTRFPVFDLHCDTAVALYDQRQSLAENTLHIDLKRARELLHHHQFYSFCCVYSSDGGQVSQNEAESRLICSLSGFLSEIEKNSDYIRICRRAEDLIAANREGKQGACGARFALSGKGSHAV